MSLRAKRRNLAPIEAPNARHSRRYWIAARSIGAVSLAVSSFLCLQNAAEARQARCYTSDDGFYDCEFVADRQGSFTISAKNKPTVILNIDEPGIAFGFVELGGRNVALPGRYRRNPAYPACWNNDAVPDRVCVWDRRERPQMGPP